MRPYICALACGVVLGGCALKAKYCADDFAAPRLIAVLPLENQSVELGAPALARLLMVERMRARGYAVQPIDRTDAVLKELGISEGGHLRARQPAEISAALAVDALVYGEIIEYNFVNIGVYQNRIVEISFAMIDPADGVPLWEDQRKVSNKKFEFDRDKIGRAFVAGLAKKVVEGIIDTPLKEECTEVIRRIAATLPPCAR